jgi:VCBS repeat-containing protein
MQHTFYSDTSGAVRSILNDAPAAAHLVIPDAHLLFNAEFKRAGADLVLAGPDGKRLVVVDYFKDDTLPALVSPEGAALAGDIVAALAGPAAPGQYAQLTAPTPTTPPIGRVETVTGNVVAVRNGVAVVLNVGDAVYRNDVIQTGSNSAVGIAFIDASAFNLTANGRILLNEFIYNPNGSGHSSLLNLVQGAATFISGQVSKAGEMFVQTPSATVGIRGTIFQLEITSTDGQGTLSVINYDQQLHQVVIRSGGPTGPIIGIATSQGGLWTIQPTGVGVAIAQESPKQAQQIQQELALAATIINVQLSAQAIFQGVTFPLATPPGPPPGVQPDPQAPPDGQQQLAPQQIGPSGSGTPPPLSPNSLQQPPGTFGPQPIPPTLPGDVPPPLPINSAPLPIILTPTDPPPPPPPGPTAVADTNSVVAGGAPTVSGNVLANDNAPNNPTVTAVEGGTDSGDTLTVVGTYGTLVIEQATGDYTYTLDEDAQAVLALAEGEQAFDVFTYTTTDGQGQSSSATLTIQVTGQNDAPVLAQAIADQASPEDAAWSFTVLAGTFADVDSDALTLSATLAGGAALPGWLSFDAATQTFSGTPPQDFDGELALTVTASDGTLSVSDTFTLDITPAEDDLIDASASPPLVEASAANPGINNSSSTLTLRGGAEYDIAALLAAGWVDNANGNFVKQGTYGTAALNINANTLSYLLDNAKADPLDAADVVFDSFSVPVTDGTNTASAVVDFTIEGRNDAPRLGSTAELSFETGLSPTWEISGSALQVTGGTDGFFAAQLSTGFTSQTEVEEFLDITPGLLAEINNAPVGNNIPTAGSAIATVIPLQAGQVLSFDWRFTTDDYNPFRDFAFFSVSTDTAIKLSDVFVVGDFGDSGWQTLSFTAPVSGIYRIGFGVMNAGDNAVQSLLEIDNVSGVGAIADQSSPEDMLWTFQVPANAFSDVDSAGLTYSATLGDGDPLPPWLNFDSSTRTFSGTPPSDFNGSIDLKVIVSDGEFSTSDVFTLTVTAVNDPPALAGDLSATVNEGGTYVITTADLNFTDPDDGAADVIFTVANQVNGTVRLNGVIAPSFTAQDIAEGRVTFVHDGSETANASFDVAVEDGDEDDSAPVAQSFDLSVSVITGDPENNILLGTAGDDTIKGLAGFDGLQGLAGNDRLFGGAHVDRAIYTDATGAITVDMAAGTVSGPGVGADILNSVEVIRGGSFADTYVATGYAGASAFGSVLPGFNQFEGMAGDDSITGNGLTQLAYFNAAAAVIVDIAAGTAAGDASVGFDTFTGVSGIHGSAFDDTLLGSNLSAPGTVELFEGRGGDDLINGRGGFDRAIYASRVNDIATIGVTIALAAGTVTDDPALGTDTLRSVESIRGTRFDDTFDATDFGATSLNAGSLGALNEFEGLAGNDSITGNGSTRISYINATSGVTVDLAAGTAAGDDSVGNDTITGGVASIFGSHFADLLSGSNNAPLTLQLFHGHGGDDTIDGRGGLDQASYELFATSGISVDMAGGTVIGDAGQGTDTLIAIESVRGTNFADQYVATGFAGASTDTGLSATFNEFEGMGGNDTTTGNGNTRISFVNATGGVNVDLAAGIATGDESVGTDTFTGVNRVRGSNFNDTIAGDNNNNVLAGLDGQDTFVFELNSGDDTVTDFALSDDVIDLAAYFASDEEFFATDPLQQTGADTLVHLPDGNSIVLAGINAGDLNSSHFQFGLFV